MQTIDIVKLMEEHPMVRALVYPGCTVWVRLSDMTRFRDLMPAFKKMLEPLNYLEVAPLQHWKVAAGIEPVRFNVYLSDTTEVWTAPGQDFSLEELEDLSLLVGMENIMVTDKAWKR